VGGLIEAFAPKLSAWIAHWKVVIAPNTMVDARDSLIFDIKHEVVATSAVGEPTASVAMTLKAGDC
jgi:hypothetical protein